MTVDQIEALAALANGIVPRDERDASAMDFGRVLAAKIESDLNNAVYFEGMQFAESTALANFGCAVRELDAFAMEELLRILRDRFSTFFKFLRAETCAGYLSDPAVWKRIGFPGPSIQTGGYPDFDQPQKRP